MGALRKLVHLAGHSRDHKQRTVAEDNVKVEDVIIKYDTNVFDKDDNRKAHR